jgi:hypothetical protein
MTHVIIGVDPHKLSATIDVVHDHERKLGEGRFPTDKAGYAAMVRSVKSWPERTWAVEGANGAGRPLAQRLLEAGEHVVDVPAKLAARVRLFDTGQAKRLLASVRPRDVAGKTRRRIAAEELAELVAVEAKMKKATAELKTIVLAEGRT